MRAPDLVADAMEDRLAQVGLERAVVSWLERIEVTDRPDEDVLRDVAGVHRVAGPPWEAAASPLAHRLDLPIEQRVQRGFVAVPVPAQQLDGCVGSVVHVDPPEPLPGCLRSKAVHN